jgi:hypothetical protein
MISTGIAPKVVSRPVLLGARSLEGFNVRIDPVSKAAA